MASSSQQPLAKRPKACAEIERAIVRSGLALAPQAEQHGVSKAAVYGELHKWDSAVTPYGNLYQALQIGTQTIDRLNPFGFLWLLAKLDDRLAAFLEKHLGGKQCRIAFYCDGVKPGNVLRPDSGREFEAVYWTFMEFPDFFRTRSAFGWLPLCFVERHRLKDVPGGMSAVAKEVVQSFWPASDDKFNFNTTGVIIPVQGREAHIRAQFGCWLADEKAINEIVHCKGASGIKPCISCKNVVNRTEVESDEYLVHISCPDVARFDRHSHLSMTAMVQELNTKRPTATAKEFAFLEKALGLVYSEHAFVFDDYCQSIARFPDTIFWDWMHCLVASGGIAQYQLNQLVLECKRAGVAIADLDAFCKNVSVPSSCSKLRHTFFEDRVVLGSGSHIKAFASEMMSAIPIVGLFLDVVLKPTGKLVDHVHCFDKLRMIIAHIARGDRAVQDSDTIMVLLQEHHILYHRLYPDCVKPKLHYLKHAVECIKKFGCNMNCFSPERKHKEAKAIAAYSFKTVLGIRLQSIVSIYVCDWFNMCS